MSLPVDVQGLAEQIHSALPQTQCTRCGFPDCRAYAEAIAHANAPINQCPPGGEEGVKRLAQITGQASPGLNPDYGQEGPRLLARIDEDWCIGCTLCLQACPVDAIIGAPKAMHSVIEEHCTGCELCIPVCPVDCINLENIAPSRTGWQAWSSEQAGNALRRYTWHQIHQERAAVENDERLHAQAQAKLADLAAASKITDPELLQRKRESLSALLARARNKRQGP
jgi:electron transport complex protein RnfB